MAMNGKFKNVLIAVLVFIIAILSIELFITGVFKKNNHENTDSTIVVQRIKKVLKLVTVEGNFSEIMAYKDFDYVDFPGFRKDAIIKANAKVSIGYNLDSLKITTNEKDKTIIISHMPRPSIISIDSDIKFQNISEGLFNHFNEEELTRLNSMSKEKIRHEALSPEIIRQAEEQKNDLFELIYYLAKANGYKVIIEGQELLPVITKNNSL